MKDAPEQLDASFSHHGMQVSFRARAPREARILTTAMAVGILLPALPMVGLIVGTSRWPNHGEAVFYTTLVGILLTLALQVTAGPALFTWAGKKALIELVVDERTLTWSREGDRHHFRLEDIVAIEALPGEIRVEGREGVQRMPCSGLKKPAIAWLEARMLESWERRRSSLEESPLQRAERQKLGRLTHQGGP